MSTHSYFKSWRGNWNYTTPLGFSKKNSPSSDLWANGALETKSSDYFYSWGLKRVLSRNTPNWLHTSARGASFDSFFSDFFFVWTRCIHYNSWHYFYENANELVMLKWFPLCNFHFSFYWWSKACVCRCRWEDSLTPSFNRWRTWNQECTFIKVRYCTFFSFYQKKTSGFCCKIRCRGGVYFTREKPYKVPIAEFATKSISSPKWFSLSWENHTPFLSKVRKVELRYTPHRYTHVISLRVFTAAGAYKFVFARIRHVSNMFLLSMFWLE